MLYTMWSVLHWIFLYCLNPNPCMHIISSFALSILSAKTDDDFKKKDIVPAISLFFMYCAFYLDPKLEHLAFQPWWCVSLIGLRYNEILIFIGGVLTGLYLVRLRSTEVNECNCGDMFFSTHDTPWPNNRTLTLWHEVLSHTRKTIRSRRAVVRVSTKSNQIV